MICENCGTMNEDTAQWCAGCGAALQADAPEQPPVAPTPKKYRKRLLFIIGGAVLAVALALLLIFGIRTPKSTVNKALEAVENGDAKAIMKLLPKQVKKGCIGDKEDQLEYQERLQKQLEDIWNDAALNDVSVNLYIKDVEDVDQDGLDRGEAYYYDQYGCEIEIDAAKDYRLVIGGYGEDNKAGPIVYFSVIKVNGNWYIDLHSIEYLIRILAYEVDDIDNNQCIV